jgi:release factor glutamine methyltransferase
VDSDRQQLMRLVVVKLAAAGVDSPDFDARQLVNATIPVGQPVTDAQLTQLDARVALRVARVPLQLVLGVTGFRLIDVLCAPGVFIPRPETEILVGLALTAMADMTAARVIEPCTGSGAISASLIAEHDHVEVCATDSNPAAVTLARTNIARVVAGTAGVPVRPASACATVLHGSLFDPVPQSFRGTTDVIVCNPPYLPETLFATLPREVREHDPVDALVGGPDGHELVGALFTAAPHWLRPGGMIAVEIDTLRCDDACDRATTAGLVQVETATDLTGARRFITARCA